MRNIHFPFMTVLAVMFTYIVNMGLVGCSDEDLVTPSDDASILKVSVVANDPLTKEMITAGFLPDGSTIGVALLNTDEEATEVDNYYNYKNVKFTASGENESQSWEPERPIYLAEEPGTAYAYYPYSETVTDVSAIPVSTTGQTDYLYAKHTNLSTSATTATFGMKHALAVVSLTVVKGSYPGAGVLTQATVRGPGICTGGKMNAKVDEDVNPLHSFTGVAEPVAVTSDITLSETGDDVNLIVVPNGQTSAFRITLTIDGKEYTTATSEIKLEPGNRYHYTVTADERQLALSSVTIGDWGYSESGAPTIMVGGYSVKLAGNLSGLAFNSSVSDGTVTIQARPKTGVWVPSSITATTGATMTSNVEGEGLITIQLSNFTDDVTVTINGHAVSLAGNLNKLAFNSKVSDGAVTIEARPVGDLWVSTGVSATSGAIMNKSVADDGSVTVNLSNITANTTVTFTGYVVTFEGDNAGMLVASRINEDASVVLHASCALSYYTPNAVSASAGSLTQSVDGNVRKINLSSIASDIALSFTGKNFAGWQYVGDGIYAVSSSSEPVAVDEATSSCIGVALINLATNQRLMIEKKEASNSSYATAGSGKNSTSAFYWGGYGTDQSIANYTSSSSALTDYNGKANSEVLKTVTTGGSSYTSYATIGAVLNQFISTSSENQGYTDWYIPACGQLFLIYENKTDINTALSAIGGTQLTADHYWSSSECSANSGWRVNLNNGNVNGPGESNGDRVRLVRDLF
ncbi:MAG: fimbrillin family protein [Parabacteroides sp.]